MLLYITINKVDHCFVVLVLISYTRDNLDKTTVNKYEQVHTWIYDLNYKICDKA